MKIFCNLLDIIGKGSPDTDSVGGRCVALSSGDPDREQIYEAHDAVNYLIIVFPLCDMNLLEFKERGLMTEDKVRDHRTRCDVGAYR